MNTLSVPMLRQCAAITALACFIPSAFADNLLFDCVSKNIQTHADENPIYRDRLKNPASLGGMLVNRQSDVHLAINEQVVLPLERGVNVTVTLVSVDQPSPDLWFWHGTFSDQIPALDSPEHIPINRPSSVLIIEHNISMTASVRYKSQLYHIMPISESLYTIVKEADSVAVAKLPGH